jgi:hypothetical protein
MIVQDSGSLNNLIGAKIIQPVQNSQSKKKSSRNKHSLMALHQRFNNCNC